MPEGPEVKLLVEKIRPSIIGRKIINASIVSGKYATKQKIANWDLFLTKLPLEILEFGCHGKFIFFKFDKNMACGVGLGMVGTFQFSLDEKHNRIRLFLGDGQVLFYNDFRNFGNWTIFNSWSELISKLNGLGLDILSQSQLVDSDINLIYNRYKNHNICKTLMNQQIISGIGVYLKSEVLYNQMVYPFSNVGDLTLEKFKSVLMTAGEIATASYDYQKNEGIDYRGNSEEGSDKRSKLFRVYDKKTCPLGYPVVKTDTPDRRTTSWVPQVQIIGMGPQSTVPRGQSITSSYLSTNKSVPVITPSILPVSSMSQVVLDGPSSLGGGKDVIAEYSDMILEGHSSSAKEKDRIFEGSDMILEGSSPFVEDRIQ